MGLTSVLEHENREDLTMDPATRKKLTSFYKKDCTCMPCRPILNTYKNIKVHKMSKKSLEENPWMEWSKINNGICYFCCCTEQENITLPSSEALSR